MKFAEHLSAHITPEWRAAYINYEVCMQYHNIHSDIHTYTKSTIKRMHFFSAIASICRNFSTEFVFFIALFIRLYFIVVSGIYFVFDVFFSSLQMIRPTFIYVFSIQFIATQCAQLINLYI